jgi:iron complex transport system substrate-binding protein
LGIATGRRDEAERLIASGKERLARIEAMTKTLEHRPRVFCMEWLEPVYCSGHWVPEMVRIAGGVDGLGQEGSDSIRIEWEDVLRWQPEVMIITPCGYDLEKTIEVSGGLSKYPGWSELPAVREAQVYAVDANSYFARPGPRVVDGTELLAHLIHPEAFAWNGPFTAFQRLEYQ